MALFEVTANDRRIYEEELKDFLPDKIFDVHCHIALQEHKKPAPLKPGEVKRTVTWPSLVAKQNSIEDLQETYELFFPGKTCKALVFSDAGHGVEINNYVADASRRSGFPALYYSHPQQSAEEIEERILQSRDMIGTVVEDIKASRKLKARHIFLFETIITVPFNPVWCKYKLRAKDFYSTDQCIGCGKCEYLCPARPFSAIYVEGYTIHHKD